MCFRANPASKFAPRFRCLNGPTQSINLEGTIRGCKDKGILIWGFAKDEMQLAHSLCAHKSASSYEHWEADSEGWLPV
jgi:hypothetical protein